MRILARDIISQFLSLCHDQELFYKKISGKRKKNRFEKYNLTKVFCRRAKRIKTAFFKDDRTVREMTRCQR